MKSNYLLASAVTLAIGLGTAAAFAGANDYTFEPTASEWKKGDDVVVAVRLTHNSEFLN